MHLLSQRLTANQIEKLNKVSITTPYEFITFFPHSIQYIQPFSQYNPRFSEANTSRYLYTGTLQSVEVRRGKRPFFILTMQGNVMLRVYLFSVQKYTEKNLKIGENYQLLLHQRNGFWNVEKYAVFKPSEIHQRIFDLGKADPNKALISVVYSKTGILQPGYFSVLHKRLKPEDYILDLRGLVPEHQQIIPLLLNTRHIHHPTSVEEFEKTLREWISLKVYLRLFLMNFLNKQNEEQFSLAGNLPLEFLKSAVSSLPFSLSSSQKQTIWDLTQEVCN